jgi:hypothetical protein
MAVKLKVLLPLDANSSVDVVTTAALEVGTVPSSV